ncbi:hypothetical protein P245_20305 [Comamonas thiooxydans]|uniref:Uncharacterized protein n=1 Tax=Comamonas thiooxydans TaxID=363952 RepID=A0A0E3BA92_9BURK|nr:hypothetical protein [Comamonas thiooxydans]KGG87408.1 hypothetical protein P245_20305 [Comamonas thiooxydans]
MDHQNVTFSSLNDLFEVDTSPLSTEDEVDPQASNQTELPEIRSVLLSGQDWEDMTRIYSTVELTETPSGHTASVKAKQYGGFLYTVFSIAYGGWNEINAWQLLPESLYEGDTCIEIDWEKVRARKRHGYSYLGLKVKVAGKVMVCAKPVNFLRSLPTVKPLSMEEALAYDIQCRRAGWRPHLFGTQAKVTWRKLAGHPVVIYELDGKDSRTALIWKHRGVIQEFSISRAEKDLNFDTETEQIDAPESAAELASKTFGKRQKRDTEGHAVQAALF